MILFTFFQIFDRTKIKLFSAKARKSLRNSLETFKMWKMNLLRVRKSFGGIFGGIFADLWVSKCPVFEYNLFHFFAIIWVTKLKSFSRKVWQSVQIGLNLNFARGTIFESGFEATLKWKANTVTVWKWCFSYLCKFFSGEVKTVFWKNEEMLWKIFA